MASTEPNPTLNMPIGFIVSTIQDIPSPLPIRVTMTSIFSTTTIGTFTWMECTPQLLQPGQILTGGIMNMHHSVMEVGHGD